MRNLVYILLFVALAGCKHSEKMPVSSENKEPDQRQDGWLTIQNRYDHKRLEGITFYAFGDNPRWEISLNDQQAVRLISESEFGGFEASHVEAMAPQDLNAMVYGAKTEEGVLSIMTFADSCDSGKDGAYPLRVVIAGKKESGEIAEFEGCGLYLNNPALHDIWALKVWSGLHENKIIDSNVHLEFNLLSNRLYGNLGCGEIEGSFNPMGDKIKIFDLGYHNQPCENNELGAGLFDHLNYKTHEIVVAGRELILAHDQDTLRFIKVD